MCDFSGKLVAFLDRELADDEMAEVHRHVRDCFACRKRLEAYGQVSGTFDAYCDAVMAAKMGRRLLPWAAVWAGATAVAVVAALILIFVYTRVGPLVVSPSVAVVSPASALPSSPAPLKVVQRRHAVPQSKTQTADWLPAEPAIQIAIPAESMFPPGALPEGVSFTADLSIAADGSAQQIRLRPRLVPFERRTIQP
jgi:anti-sigma factor RsiW